MAFALLLRLLQFLFFIWRLLVVGLLIAVRKQSCNYGKNRKTAGEKRLPPGSMGWPYVGETLELYSQDPNIFFSSRHRRYGDLFKSHILGCPCVMVADPEAVKFILVKKAHLFRPTFPASKERLLGPNALFFHQGDYHTRIRKLVHNSVGPDAIRSIVPDIDAIAQRTLRSWSDTTVVAIQELKKYAFEVGIHAVFGNLEERYKRDLSHYYHELKKGYNSLPINLPGTRFHKSLKARKKLEELIKEIIEQWRRLSNEQEVCSNMRKNMLGSLMDSEEDEAPLSQEQVVDNIIGVLFAAHDTTATALTWLIKYLTDNPSLLLAVTAEQEAVRQSLGESKPLAWAETRNMTLTCRVIQETLRMASVISFTFREAVEDVAYKGYVIPKGWKVMPLFRVIHHNPDFYEEPSRFNPSRFEKPPKPTTYMAFGNGVHSCPGNELAKVEMLVFIHHLTTTYRCEVVGKRTGIQYRPFPVPQEGLPLKITRRDRYQTAIEESS